MKTEKEYKSGKMICKMCLNSNCLKFAAQFYTRNCVFYCISYNWTEYAFQFSLFGLQWKNNHFFVSIHDLENNLSKGVKKLTCVIKQNYNFSSGIGPGEINKLYFLQKKFAVIEKNKKDWIKNQDYSNFLRYLSIVV